MYKIHSVEKDMAGKYRVKVKINESESIQFKFDHIPDQDEVDLHVERLIQARIAEYEKKKEGDKLNEES